MRDERIEIRKRQAELITRLLVLYILTSFHSGTRNGRHYDDDFVFQREAPRPRTPPRPRSPSPAPVRDERIEIRQRCAVCILSNVPRLTVYPQWLT